MQLIAQGAEARIFLDGKNIIKERVPKTYRHPEIDAQLRGSRTRREAKVLETLTKAGFASPKVVSMDDKSGKMVIELIEGEKLRDLIAQDAGSFGKAVGRLLGELHNLGIVHGDPTTSNMIVRDGQVHLIDFGLSQFSEKAEDRAVDLHLLDRAVESAHHQIHITVMKAANSSYLSTAKEGAETMKRLESVRKTGRNKLKGGS